MIGSHPDFYPTPPLLAARMLSGIDWRTVKAILEPSAGKGDLADAVKRRSESRYAASPTLDCIEIDPDLQHVLRGKGHNVVHNDFRTFESRKQYDLIVANFPFSEGDRHLEQALRHLEQNGGGSLVALVNAETIRNPFTRIREVNLQTIERLGGTVEYIADAFRQAERPTDVEVALVRVAVPKSSGVSLVLEHLAGTRLVDEATAEPNQLMETDPARALVARFDLEVSAGVRLIREYEALRPLMLNRLDLATSPDDMAHARPVMELKVDAGGYFSSPVNNYIEAIRGKYWEALVRNDRFRSGFTSNILDALEKQLEQLKSRDFTPFNIHALERELRATIPSGIEAAIVDMFDEFSRKYSHYEGTQNNVHYYTGWKSNKAHKIANKIILPINGFSAYSGGFSSHYIRSRIADMVKAFAYLDAGRTAFRPDVDVILSAASEAGVTRNIDFGYFTATFYKKGTCHIRFRDQVMLDRLNIYGSQRKGWLPPSYGRTAYREMVCEDQAVVTDFHAGMGTTYHAVMERSEFYLADPSAVPGGLAALGG